MRKLVIATMALGIMASSVSASTYECWMYKYGKPQWYVNVSASSKSEAQSKAAYKFDKIGRSGDYIKCK
jgi:hypothetical protein